MLSKKIILLIFSTLVLVLFTFQTISGTDAKRYAITVENQC